MTAIVSAAVEPGDYFDVWDVCDEAAGAPTCGLPFQEPAALKRLQAIRMAELEYQGALFRDVAGNPFRPRPLIDQSWLSWNNSTVAKLAQAIYDNRDFDRMPILADALEDAGCHDVEILTHCRGPGPHVRGCWVLDLLLGKT